MALEQIVAQALEKQPEKRPKNMQEVVRRLRAIESSLAEEVTGPTVLYTQPVSTEAKKAFRPHVWRKWLGLLLGTAAVSALVIWIVTTGPQLRSPQIPIPEKL